MDHLKLSSTQSVNLGIADLLKMGSIILQDKSRLVKNRS